MSGGERDLWQGRVDAEDGAAGERWHQRVVFSPPATEGVALLGLASSWPMTMLGAVVFGVGIGLLTPNLNTWTARLVSARQRGRALGNLNTATFLGQFLSPLIAAPILRAGVSLEHVFVWGGATAGLIALVESHQAKALPNDRYVVVLTGRKS